MAGLENADFLGGAAVAVFYHQHAAVKTLAQDVFQGLGHGSARLARPHRHDALIVGQVQALAADP